MSNDKQKKSWRDLLPIHPAADLFPLMSSDELKALAEDITKHGLRKRVMLLLDYTPWADGSFADTTEMLLDGRNRLDAMESLGWSLFDKKGRLRQDYIEPVDETESDPDADFDPFAYVISANIHRRHLKPEDIPGLIAKILKARPEMSNRQVAKIVGKSHPYVAKTREQLEQAGDVETVTTSLDTKNRKQPAHKARRPDKERLMQAVEKTARETAKEITAREAAQAALLPKQPQATPEPAALNKRRAQEREQREATLRVMANAADAVAAFDSPTFCEAVDKIIADPIGRNEFTGRLGGDLDLEKLERGFAKLIKCLSKLQPAQAPAPVPPRAPAGGDQHHHVDVDDGGLEKISERKKSGAVGRLRRTAKTTEPAPAAPAVNGNAAAPVNGVGTKFLKRTAGEGGAR